ncbi:major facilitator superfamily domain-containing protein [Cytidiella melzeri]|nr:major facilitator superfamily domain-containing protein [Cytidiella melzeri]
MLEQEQGTREVPAQEAHADVPPATSLDRPHPSSTVDSVPRDFFLIPVPKHLRHSPGKPAHFGLFLNIVFAAATTFIVCNLYWCQPILIELSLAFDVSYNKVSNVPTLLQGGYAAGLLLIAPLGDLVRRRPLILLLTALSTALTFGLAFTRSFVAFQILSFLIGAASCTPQILVPLAADIAPPHRRASVVSIVISGLLFGILVARVVAGLIAEFVSWRIVFYLAIGLQGFTFAMLYPLMPDYPVRNTGLTYGGILWSMAKFAVTEPVLIQASLVSLASMACFTNFWVTLTFLLGGAPYFYSTLVIGLFGLVGMAGVLSAPLTGRLIDNLIPWVATVICTTGLILFQAVQTGAGGVTVAAVVIACFGIDVLRQMQQVSLTTAVFALDPQARSRMNSVLLVAIFAGQIMGTAVGTSVFLKFGWRPAAALSLAWTGFCLFVMLVRGPHCSRYTWFGYEGGLRLRKPPVESQSQDVEKAQETVRASEESSNGGGKKQEGGEGEKESVYRVEQRGDDRSEDSASTKRN